MNTLIEQPLSRNAVPAAARGLPEPLRHNLARSNQLDKSRTEKMKNRIKVLLVDDHPVVRRGISSCLAREPHVVVVGEAANGVEALRKARELLPDVVLMDIEMPQMNGLAVTEALYKELPQIKVLILSMHMRPE